MESVLGRPLTRREHVHHKDGNRLNNDPANLLLLDAAEHPRRHLVKHPLVLFCAWCGEPFLNVRRRPPGPHRCCSNSCAARRRHQIARTRPAQTA